MNIVAQLLNPESLEKLGASPALRWHGGVQTYAQLNSNINFIGKKYRECGLRTDDRVILISPDTPYFIAAYLAVLKIGAVAIAASTRSSIDDLQEMIKDSGAKMIICDSAYEKYCRRALSQIRNDLTIVNLVDMTDGIETAQSPQKLARKHARSTMKRCGFTRRAPQAHQRVWSTSTRIYCRVAVISSTT